MEEIKDLELIKAFVDTLQNYRVESTGAAVVTINANLYNVDGSTHDPKKVPGHEGDTWKKLLKDNGIDHNCYVTNPNAEGVHPEFSVGGHMTTNSNGQVANGGTCYLMPECSWHNNKARDGVEYTHTETQMLKLTGYNLGELPVTFKLRLPSDQPFAVLYYDQNEWKFKNISRNEAEALKGNASYAASPLHSVEYYVLIERKRDEKTTHHVLISKLP
ncbi:MAG TPA: hypothetical protein VFS71_14175 [Flavobacterium sp.]|uniref:hypothetical protein n=1 Tax=Flavobacterium sp. TaxID=239 RepID=UPI002DB77EC0|nr:hypothetical protein [Flavobacterium sp.]HEU4790829.1 hypothetical protein [Flavobacterium sp.]